MVAQGTTLAGRYRLDTRIGAGGMGEVWRGEDTVLARTVAVKVLLPGRTDDPGFLVRFQGEARAMATINHPGVVDVYDYGVHEVPGAGATAYLVMKFVDGEPLDRLLGRLGSIAPGAAMELIAQAASALQAVHDQGIVHRDVKPGNLLVRSDGTLVLTDFGIARSDAASRLTDAGMVLGTASYCAPEQAEGAPVTPAVDIYALGVVAYECLAGQRPFDGDSPVTIALKHIREAPPPLPERIPPAIRALVERALSKDPARRFPSAAAMSTAARQAIAGPETGATVLPPAQQPMPGAVQGLAGQGAAPRQDGPYPETGWSAAAQPTAGWQAASPAPPGTPTELSPGRRGRRGAKPKRRGGLLAMASAGAVVVCGGLVAVALNTMAASSEVPGIDRARATDPAVRPVDTEPTKSPSPKPTRTRPKPTPTQNRQVPDPTPEVTEEPEPTPTPTKSPSPKPTPTKGSPSPTPTPTPVAKKKVPNVTQLPLDAALQQLKAAGLRGKVQKSGGSETQKCWIVYQQYPPAGEMLDPRVPVELIADAVACAGDPTQTPTPTATKG
ncbi:protein kinase [Planomonospora sp. ID91781]|uniref:serine/threonine protein kinase n=1 Tax=Planomonospora sp. ID91781 TaxID=2738135 RepID=UPI0018C3A107|nr:serine/threonine protein kinase [Planomonospora sp. ID91781]MBG0825524.1 protein kinase [Planomonospora sp. ID91781]